MTPHGEARRRSARVEWMRLDSLVALDVAYEWAQKHGVVCILTTDEESDGWLSLFAADGGLVKARLGQVLTRDPASGEFAVWDVDEFEEQHREIGVVQ